MELVVSRDALALVDGESVLHCCFKTGRITTQTTACLGELEDPQCLGICYGLIGKLPEITPSTHETLLIIVQRSLVGTHPLNEKDIFKIARVAAVPLTAEKLELAGLALDPCPKHTDTSENSGGGGFGILQKGQRKILKTTIDSLHFVKNQVNREKKSKNGGPTIGADDRQAKRLVDEVLRLFNEQPSFYTCPGGDLTHSCQRLLNENYSAYDERFFWNRHLVADLLESEDKNALGWVTPVVQGFVGQSSVDLEQDGKILLTLISRRSVHRAGTRYIKRGIDEKGNCANYVETEQIVSVLGHNLSFVQVRGSVPVYWSQRGYKYRPPPQIERSKPESLAALQEHFSEQISLYGSPIAVVNLVDQSGREKPLGDAYLDHVLDYDNPELFYIAFDFHDYCRALRMENLDVLMNALPDVVRSMRFAWADNRRSLVCSQNGVFRVNCVDCLDRTNVVQWSLAQVMLEYQLVKLGVWQPLNDRDSLGEFGGLPETLVKPMQLLWADNGDSISLQYAGTAALKGDVTRGGQRNLAGLMRDGYHSASRYYLSHVRDARRQAAIDAVLGKRIDTAVLSDEIDAAEPEDNEVHEELRMLVQECQQYFVSESENLVGGWALVNADPGTGRQDGDQEMDRVILLTRTAYYVADYDELSDKFTDHRRVPLECVSKVQVGPMPPSRMNNLLSRKQGHTCVRVHNAQWQELGVARFYVWRAAGTRLFNNMAIALKTAEDADEYVRAIAEQFRVALEIAGVDVPLEQCAKIERQTGETTSRLPRAPFAMDLSGFGSKVSWPFRRVLAKTSRPNPLSDKETGPPLHSATLQHSIVSPSAGILYVYEQQQSESKSPELNHLYAYDDMSLTSKNVTLLPLEQTDCALECQKPTFSVEPPNDDTEETRQPEHSVNGVDTLGTGLSHGPSISSLRSEEPANGDGQELGLSDLDVNMMKTSKSEGTLHDMAQVKTEKKSARNRLMGKLAAGGGKFLDLTVSGFAKVSSQVQMFGAGSAALNERRSRNRADLMAQFENRIDSSKCKIVLL